MSDTLAGILQVGLLVAPSPPCTGRWATTWRGSSAASTGVERGFTS